MMKIIALWSISLLICYSFLITSDNNLNILNKHNPEKKKQFFRQDTKLYTEKQKSEDFSDIQEEHDTDSPNEKHYSIFHHDKKNIHKCNCNVDRIAQIECAFKALTKETQQIKSQLGVLSAQEKCAYKNLGIMTIDILNFKNKVRRETQNLRKSIENNKKEIEAIKPSWCSIMARLFCCCFIASSEEIVEEHL